MLPVAEERRGESSRRMQAVVVRKAERRKKEIPIGCVVVDEGSQELRDGFHRVLALPVGLGAPGGADVRVDAPQAAEGDVHVAGETRVAV